MKHIVVAIMAIAGLSAAALGVFASCASEREPAAQGDSSEVIGRDLMISLGQAKNFHRKAKVYMTDGNLAAATASVRQVLSLPFPKGAPEAEDVRNDARALLAKLLVSQGQIDEATRTVDEGLAQSQRESFFVANLYTVQGEIHEARAAAFDAAGDSEKAAATEQRRAAITSYDRSIQINERLQKKLVEER